MRRRRRSLALLTRGLPTLVGWAVIVVAVDWGLGALIGGEEPPPRTVAVEVEGQIPLDPRVDGEAMAPYPWREAYFEELNSLEYGYAPYVVGRLGHNDGEYINTTPEERRSYRPASAEGPEAVDVWFLGGSTMFGEGQRDDYTIPSYVARRAEAEGLPVRVHNLGQQGIVAWQELLVFEREMARRGPPDVVVFYDGTNDFNVQFEVPDDQPVHYDAGDFWAGVEPEGLPLPRNAALPEPSAWQSYRATSALGRLWEALGPEAASAATNTHDDGVRDPQWDEQLAVLDEVESIYLRMVDLATFLAESHGVRPFFFWQPVQLDPGHPYRILAERLPDPVIDLSASLDHPPAEVYLDGGHTNELGAELVAEAMYPHLAPALGQAP